MRSGGQRGSGRGLNDRKGEDAEIRQTGRQRSARNPASTLTGVTRSGRPGGVGGWGGVGGL